jgi:hypothetical protein
VTLKAMLERGELPGQTSLDAIVAHFRSHFADERYRDDVIATPIEDVRHVARDVIAPYIVRNPINAWVGGNTRQALPYFAYDGRDEVFRYIGPRPASPWPWPAPCASASTGCCCATSSAASRASGSTRSSPTAPAPASCSAPTPPTACPATAAGNSVRIGERFLYAKFAAIAINVIADTPQDGAPNRIVEVLKELFGDPELLAFRRAYRVRVFRRGGGGGGGGGVLITHRVGPEELRGRRDHGEPAG